MATSPSERTRAGGVLGVGALGLALAAMSVCGYRFGVGDQAQYLVRAVGVRDPEGLGADPYLGAFGAIKSVVWDILAAAVPERGWAAAALVLTVGAAAGSALTLASLARAMISPADRRGALGTLACLTPAALLVVPKELNWFGLVSLADMELTATVLVMPAIIGSMALFVRGRAWWSLVMAAVAVPIHGQTAAYALCAWTLAMVWVTPWRSRPFAGVLGVGVLGAVAFALATTIGEVAPEHMDSYRAVGLDLYAPLIEPARAPFAAWGAGAGVIALGVLAWPGVMRGGGRERDCARRLGVYALASLAFPLAFTALLALGWREPLAWRLMPGRGLMLAQLVAVVAVGVWAARSVLTGGRGAWWGAGALALVAVWPFAAATRALGIGDGGGAWAGAVGLAAAAGAIAVGVRLDAVPVGLRGGRAPRGALLAVLALIAFVGLAAFARRGHPWARTSQPAVWVEAQEWAREHTAPGTVFVTPPYRAGWRVGSHRPTFGELRDGGLLFYAGEPVLDWAERMRLLGDPFYGLAWSDGGDGPLIASGRVAYDASLGARLDEIVDTSGASYVVRELVGRPAPFGERVWENGVYEIRSIAPGE